MQPTQDFSTENLLWMRGRKVTPALKKASPTDREGWTNLAGKIEERVADGTFKFQGLFSSVVLEKKILSTSDPGDALVLRKINDNIRRAYGVRQTQRSHSVRLLRQALSEWTPKGIVSVDLKSCFETITPRVVLDKLRHDGKVSHQTIHLLEVFFNQTRQFGANKYSKGLPRGVLISSTLAEIFLKDLDRYISEEPGVYVYVRYVDDIMIINAGSARKLFPKVLDAIARQGLKVNRAKTALIDAGCQCAFECQHASGSCPCAHKCQCTCGPDNLASIDYLGYKFVFATGKKLREDPACYTLLATAKSKKIKSRIARAIQAFVTDKDYGLLRDRIALLTKNVTVDKSLKRSRLKSGIAFTYEEYSPPPLPHDFREATFEALDDFLKSKLRRLSSGGSLFNYMQKRSLLRNSFVAGHKKRHRISFDPKRMARIRSCWDAR